MTICRGLIDRSGRGFLAPWLFALVPFLLFGHAAAAPLTEPALAAGQDIRQETGEITLNAAPVTVIRYIWRDSKGDPRSVSLAPASPSTMGYAVQMSHVVVDAGIKRIAYINADPAGDGGFGYFVSHELFRDFIGGGNGTIAGLHGEDDSPLGRYLASTGTAQSAGTVQAAHEFRLAYPRWGTVASIPQPDGVVVSANLADHQRYLLPVIVRWHFVAGQDYPLWSVDYDVTSANDHIATDVRGPYGAMVFNEGNGPDVTALKWGDKYLFVADAGNADFGAAAMPPGGLSWTWNTLNNGRRYNVLASGAYEFGLVDTVLFGASLYGDGYSAGRRGSTSAAAGGCPDPQTFRSMPCDYEWAYQSFQYESAPPARSKIAWGSSPFLGSSTPSAFNGVDSEPISGLGHIHYGLHIVYGRAGAGTPLTITRAAAAKEANPTLTTSASPAPGGAVSYTVLGDTGGSYTVASKILAPWASVSLTATPAAGYNFASWNGACAGVPGSTCIIAMDQSRSVTATFTATASQFGLTVTKSGTGGGTVTSNPAGIDCGSTCSASFDSGTPVTLSASAAAGSTFTGWSGGGCSGTGMCTVTMNAAASVTAAFSLVSAPALLNSSVVYGVTSTNDNVTRAGTTALVTRLDNFGTDKRPVVVLMPGWGGAGDVAAARDAQALMFANAGYVALSIGFHQTGSVPSGALAAWYSDLAESAKAALDTLCVQTYADCSAVVLTGESYGGTQTHPVVRFLRAGGVYDGSGGANAGRKVVGMLGQDSGYSLYWTAPVDADATAYSIAMIENLGDGDFPVDSCDYGNCGARNRADYHQAAAGNQYVLSYCPAGGTHGSRGYADWDAWVLSAVKTMLHIQRGVPTFTGYVAPSIAVSNACLSAPALPGAPTIGTASAGNASISVGFTPGTLGSGTLVRYTADCGGVTNTGMSSPITVNALTNGTAYTCRVKTTSTVGDGPWSAPSNQVTPGTSAFALTVSRSGTGSGSVTSAPAGIDCGSTCSANFNSGASVTLTASPAAGSIFSGWSGSGCTGIGACSVTLNAATTVTATFILATSIPRMVNIASRGRVQTDANVLIAGFIIGGDKPKKVLVTARGPSVAVLPSEVSLLMADPMLTLYSGATPIASNDDWQTPVTPPSGSPVTLLPADQIPTTQKPGSTKDAAILTTLAPGAYTAIVEGVGGATGLSIVEVFEEDLPEVPLVNIATRGRVEPGANVMIAGFIIQGDAPKKVLVTARGPSVAVLPSEVPLLMADPKVTLYSGATPIASNDDWQTLIAPPSGSPVTLLPPDQIQATQKPGNAKDAAILTTLAPGAYTAIVEGVGNTSGIVIVEVFAQ